MAAYINAKRTYTGTGAQVAIPLNRWSRDNYSVVTDVGATATYTVEGTIDQINRIGVTPVWFDITGLVGLTASTSDKITDTPLEALRVNIAANSGELGFHVMQNGEG